MGVSAFVNGLSFHYFAATFP